MNSYQKLKEKINKLKEYNEKLSNDLYFSLDKISDLLKANNPPEKIVAIFPKSLVVLTERNNIYAWVYNNGKIDWLKASSTGSETSSPQIVDLEYMKNILGINNNKRY
jgi:hypothetical protein